MPVAGRGVSEIGRLVRNGADVIVRRAPDLAQSKRAEAAGQSDIGQTAVRLAGIGSGDRVLELVNCGEPVADFVRAPDAPAREAVKELGVCAAAELQSAAQRAVPAGFGENN